MDISTRERIKAAIKYGFDRSRRGEQYSMRDLAQKYQINRKTLARHWLAFVSHGNQFNNSYVPAPGARRYLSECGIRQLRLYVLALESLQITVSTSGDFGIPYAMCFFRAKERGGEDFNDINPPDRKTVASFINQSKLKVRKSRSGIDARASKATTEYIGGFFELLQKVRDTYPLGASEM